MDKPLVDMYMRQNEEMLRVVPQHLLSLREAIDKDDGQSIALFLDMLRSDYHHIEGNHATIKRLLSKSDSGIDQLLER